MWKIQN